MNRSIPRGRLLKLAAIGALSVSLAVNVPGCSIIGLTVGRSIDRHGTVVDTDQLQKLAYGRRVIVRLRDGGLVEGMFAGWLRDSTAALPDSGIAFASTSPSLRGSRVRIATPDGHDMLIPAENIAVVRLPGGSGAPTLFLLGAALDVIVITSGSSKDCGGSECAVRPN